MQISSIFTKPSHLLGIILSILSLLLLCHANVAAQQATFTINAGTVNMSSGRFYLSGDWTNSGTFTAIGGIVVFNGTGDQTITNASGETFNNLTVDKTSGNLVLNTNVTVKDTLTLTSGNISTGANTLTLGSTGEGTLSRTSGTIVGKFARYIDATTGSRVFPVGTSSNYRPLLINYTDAPTSAGTITVSHIDSGGDFAELSPPLDDSGYTVDYRSQMYWTTTASSIAGGTYSLNIDANGQAGIEDPANLRVIHSTDGTNFDLVGTHSDGEGTIARRTDISGDTFGRFYIGGNDTLPASVLKLGCGVTDGFFVVTVEYNGDLVIKGCEIVVSYDASVVSYDSYSAPHADFNVVSVADNSGAVTIDGFFNPEVSGDIQILTLRFTGVAAGEANIGVADSDLRGMSGDTQVFYVEGVDYVVEIDVECDRAIDTSAPTVDSVLIESYDANRVNPTLQDYVKHGDTVIVRAIGYDEPRDEIWAAGVDANGVTADLSLFGGGSAVTPTTFNYDSDTRQWTATWELSGVTCNSSDGTVNVTVSATDKVGNGPTTRQDDGTAPGDDGTAGIVADNIAPDVTNPALIKIADKHGIAVIYPEYAKDGDTVGLTATVSDANSASMTANMIWADFTQLGLTATEANSGTATSPSWSKVIPEPSSLVDGSKTVTIHAEDKAGNVATGTDIDDTINLDNTAPSAVSSFQATPNGSAKLQFSFIGTFETDYIGIRFSRQSASQLSGSLGYPRYDAGGYPIPDGYESGKTCNHDDYYAESATDGDATHIDETYTSDPGDPVTYDDTIAGQDVYYYQSYVYDKAGNFSTADSNHNDRDSATGYFLGDFDHDGDVDIDDIALFANAFGTDHNHASWDTFDDCDIGPTGGTQTRGADNRFGLPTTDGVVDFEDLMIFAMNFNNVGVLAPFFEPTVFPKDTPLVSLDVPRRAIAEGEIFQVALKLSHELRAKGAHLMLNYDRRYFEVVKVSKGNLGMTFFKAEDKGNSIDINVAALGTDVSLADETIATVEFRAKGSAPNAALYLSKIDVRGVRNERADDKLAELGGVGISISVGKPDVTEVLPNYPNPFNPETWIPFQLEKATDVRVMIYDIKGQLVKTIELGHKPAGYYWSKDQAVHWDGRNSLGEKVSSGIYFYQFQAGKTVKSGKMTILK